MAMKPSKMTIHDQIRAEDGDGVLETPSRKIVRENAKANTHTIEDDLGRVIIYKNMSPLDQARLFKAIGDLSSNQMYTQMAMTACSVQSIDGEFGPPVTSVLTVEARIGWVGDEGYNAIWMDIRKRLDDIINEKSPEQIAEEYSSTLKKSSGTPD